MFTVELAQLPDELVNERAFFLDHRDCDRVVAVVLLGCLWCCDFSWCSGFVVCVRSRLLSSLCVLGWPSSFVMELNIECLHCLMYFRG